jgi:subtilisin family serine protease
MGRRVILATGMSIVLVAGIMQGAAVARPGAVDGLRRLDAATLRDLRKVEGLGPRALRVDGRVAVVVELNGPPVAAFDARELARTRHRLAPAERGAIRDRIIDGQELLESRVAALDGRVHATYQDAINGLRVSIPRARLGRLAALPGVAAVHAIPRYEPGLLNTGRFVNSPTTWTDTGRTGNGVTIAIIDTGIDYTHADFGGSGNAAQYAADDGLSRATGAPFPTPKVIEGWDLAGDDYDADDPANDVPLPDDDPIDCNGHGTHVAGIAAGAGVKKVGSAVSPFSGPYNATKFESTNFTVAPGVAPRARLVALKVFGCDGSTDLVVDAIDQAVEMGVDVINMSLGSAFARGDDLTAIAVDNASDAGVVVVGSAGNSGPSAYIHGGVTTGDKGISVGAVDARPQSTDYREPAWFTSGGPRNGDSALKPDISAPGVNIKSADAGGGTSGVSYSGTSMASPVVAGAAALVIEARPTWSSTEIKSVLVGTAAAGKKKFKPAHYDLLLAGAGSVNAYRATRSVAFARTATGGAGLSFGYDEISGPFSETQTFELVNRSQKSITYSLDTSFDGPSHGAVMVLSRTSVTVPAGGSRVISATLKLSATNVRKLPGAIVPVDFDDDGVPYQPLVSVKGVIVATPPSSTGRYPLRVPFLSVPRGISNIALSSSGPYSVSGDEATFSGTLANTGATNHIGTADLYAWGLSDANDGLESNDIRAVGVQQFVCDDDPRYGCVADDRLIAFAVSTWGRWSNASTDEFDVAIDVDGDTEPDFAVFTTDAGSASFGDLDGTQMVITCELDAELLCDDLGLFDGFFVDSAPNGSIAWLPTVGSWLGLDGANGQFDYTAASTNIFPSMSSLVDSVTDGLGEPVWASWHAWTPQVNTGDFYELAVGASRAHVFRASYPNVAAYGAPRGWLVVTVDDASGAAQADRVPLGMLP